jgi:hypothetical protein
LLYYSPGKRAFINGSTLRVAFSLAFADNRLAPEAGFFVCQQHAPENFWNPAFEHGLVSSSAGITIRTPRPSVFPSRLGG